MNALPVNQAFSREVLLASLLVLMENMLTQLLGNVKLA